MGQWHVARHACSPSSYLMYMVPSPSHPCTHTQGFSGSDLMELCSHAAQRVLAGGATCVRMRSPRPCLHACPQWVPCMSRGCATFLRPNLIPTHSTFSRTSHVAPQTTTDSPLPAQPQPSSDHWAAEHSQRLASQARGAAGAGASGGRGGSGSGAAGASSGGDGAITLSLRPVDLQDFEAALRVMRPATEQADDYSKVGWLLCACMGWHGHGLHCMSMGWHGGMGV